MVSSGSTAVPEALRHPPSVGGEHGRVDDHVGERDLPHQLQPGPDHPVLPEPDDLAGRRVDVAGVVAPRAPESAPASRASRRATAPTRTRCRARPGRATSSTPAPARSWASASVAAQIVSPSGVVQIGSWCPHQSWRDRHQSGISSSEEIANRCCDTGWNRTLRSRSASSAGWRAPPSGTTTEARSAARSASGSARRYRRRAGSSPA